MLFIHPDYKEIYTVVLLMKDMTKTVEFPEIS